MEKNKLVDPLINIEVDHEEEEDIDNEVNMRNTSQLWEFLSQMG